MKNYGDPQSQMFHIGSFLSEVYNDTRLVNLAMGEPKPGNLTQIHDEVMKKLECMAYAHQHNARISGYPIPFCSESATLWKMYTMEELRAAGVITAMTASANPVTSGQPAGSEFEESDITNTEGLHEVTEESTDTEMMWQTHTLMITSDREKVQLEALVKEQDRAIDEAVRQVQEWHLEEVQAIADAIQHQGDGRSSFKHRSTSREEDVKKSREESPEYSSTPQERGHSLHCKSKSDIWCQPHLVGGVQAPRILHHPDTALIADPDPIVDTTLIAKAPCPAGHVTEIPARTPPGRDQWPKLQDQQKQRLCSHQHRKLQN